MGMPKLHHVAINVTNVQRAIRFYEEVFGLRQIPRENTGNTTPTGAWFDVGGLQLHLQGRESGAVKTDQHFALEVSSVEEAGRRAQLREGKFQTATPLPGFGSRGNIYDPDGNRIEILGRE